MLVRRPSQLRHVRHGFTLMELLAVVAILAVLAGVAVPTYMYFAEKAKLGVAKADCKRFAATLDQFAVTHLDDFPQTSGYPDPSSGWAFLIQEALIPSEPLDPWKKPYMWSLDSSSGRLKAVVSTTAPDNSTINSMDVQ